MTNLLSVKNLISSTPVLAATSLDEPSKLHVDASNFHQLNYSIVEKEALALIWALQDFEVYVGGGKSLVVYADHNALTFLHSLQNPNQRLMRCCLFFYPFSLEIGHIKGSANFVADALSCVLPL